MRTKIDALCPSDNDLKAGNRTWTPNGSAYLQPNKYEKTVQAADLTPASAFC